MTEPASLPRPRRILVVSAHPDDPEFGFGASLAKLTRAGARAAYVVCSDGAQGGEDPTQSDQELIDLRQREQRAAADVLGVDEVRFLGFRDGHLAPDLELRRAITAEIRRFRPDLVMTHNPTRALTIRIGAFHPDHLAVGEATMAAVYPDARNPRAFRELLADGLTAHKVQEIWLSAHPEPNHVVDVTGFVDLKLQAIQCHHSQFQGRSDFDASKLEKELRERMRTTGEKSGYGFAEAFYRIDAS